ncbi:MAG: YcgN family cysteine cluster protein [Anderseniella sp.]|nr:YcgN family cysteine cluster protein [Anderseniella sp.]
MTSEKPFWQTKQLHEMTTEEWESLCDGCGRCCLVKLEDEDTGEIHDTDVSCQLLDCSTCRCTDYANRHEIVDDCIKLDVDKLEELRWLPRTCAYRLLWEGKPLFDWHPLVSGDPQSVHEAGVSVKDKVTNEREVALEDLVNRIREW